MTDSLTLPNDIQTVPQLNVFIDTFCEQLDVDMDTVASLNLALEEAVVNVMEYAYPKGVGYVYITVESEGDSILFTLKDKGLPFDPTKKEEVDTTLPAEQRPIGGLGIHLVRRIMDEIVYDYKDGMNILKLKKNIKKQ